MSPLSRHTSKSLNGNLHTGGIRMKGELALNTDKIGNYISRLHQDQRIQLIDVMEKEIMDFKRGYPIEYFRLLENYLICEKEEASCFDDFEKIDRYLKKLSWLKGKNDELQYTIKEKELCKMLRQALPKELHEALVALIDLSSQRTTVLKFGE